MTSVAEHAAQLLGSTAERATPVGGGCISDAQQVVLTDGRTVFVKSGHGLPPGLLEVEAEGLQWLASAGALRVPEVLAIDAQALVLAWVEPGASTPTTDEQLGAGLARLHRSGADAFGFGRDGFVGPLPMSNAPDDDWLTFYVERRVRPFAIDAVAAGCLDARVLGAIDGVADRVRARGVPVEPPARLHGDLWPGNVHVGRDGVPWLVDPAAYGGHREVDLAMLDLFGGLAPRCVAAYDDVHPLAEGWRDRLVLWQLFPLLVHARLFGGSYGAAAASALDRLA